MICHRYEAAYVYFNMRMMLDLNGEMMDYSDSECFVISVMNLIRY